MNEKLIERLNYFNGRARRPILAEQDYHVRVAAG